MNETTFRADLHCHTNCSDGTDDPIALLHIAKKAGLKGLSVTDHDTIDAYTPLFFAEAQKLEIQILPGIEISSELNPYSIHILGYGIDLESIPLKAFLKEIQNRRNERNRSILKKLRQKNLPIEEEELMAFALTGQEKRTIGRPHIAALMVQKGFVRTPQEAFEHYLKEGASCYASGIKYTPLEAIQAIHEAKGKAVLAHPHFLKRGALVKQLLRMPLDGLECYYGNLSKGVEAPWVQIAKDKRILATGGSDYHGSLKPHISLGCSWVSEETFRALQGQSSNGVKSTEEKGSEDD